MKTYFVVSDTHSFYTPLKKALWQAGFRRTNKDHILIVCGDLFDRGQETLQVYNYIKSLPRSRRILVRGNHEALYLDLLKKRVPDSYDFSNGTVRTFCAIAGMSEEALTASHWYKTGISGYEVYDRISETWRTIVAEVKNSAVTKFVESKKDWVNYYELGKYIFVHSFIPYKLKDEVAKYYWPHGYIQDDWKEYKPNWRQSSDFEWSEAAWGCPYAEYELGLFKPEEEKGKILVCGHWHAAAFHEEFEGAKEMENHHTYIGEHLIALDACTVLSKFINVLVIKEDEIGA